MAVPVYNIGLADSGPFTVRLINRDGVELESVTLELPAGAGAWAGPWSVEESDWGTSVRVELDAEGAVEECDESNRFVLGGWWCD